MKTTLPNTSSKAKLSRDVADPEQRHLLVSAQIRTGLPLQIRAMREDRGWTQTTLAEKLGTTQNTVSRLENPKTSKPTITTLKRIAEAFDVALIVKFAPFSELVDSIGGMSPKSVAVPSYEAENKTKESALTAFTTIEDLSLFRSAYADAIKAIQKSHDAPSSGLLPEWLTNGIITSSAFPPAFTPAFPPAFESNFCSSPLVQSNNLKFQVRNSSQSHWSVLDEPRAA